MAAMNGVNGAAKRKRSDVLVLFDVDGTLTAPRKDAEPEMLALLQKLRKVVDVGIVGGSDLVKISEQLGKDTVSSYDFVFSENGLMAHKAGELLATQSLKKHLGDAAIKEFINFTLRALADCECPVKRGTFIEFRNGMMNISPVGRNCSQEERDAFEVYDKEHGLRAALVAKLRAKFGALDLTYSIGGQISFDVFPKGWDKTFCLRFVEEYKEVHFFGDKTHVGGNDHEIFASERTIGHTVVSWEDTIKQVTELFMKN